MKQKKQLFKLLILLVLLAGTCCGAWVAGVFETASFHASWNFSTATLLRFLLLLFGALVVSNLLLLLLRCLTDIAQQFA